MREIIGENMNNIFIILGIDPRETFSGSIGYWSNFKVWEVDDFEYKSLCEITDEQFERWSEEGAWWRCAEGSNQGIPDTEFVVNNHPILAWRNMYKIHDLQAEWDELPSYERSEYKDFDDYCDVWLPKKHKNILNYMCDELSASTERNVCALAVDLAKYNNVTMAELFRKYGGTNGNS